ncbi:protein-disulfide reductase DsbD family protein [bacterium]|nr:protein-disulfide reductase DsbD family protein [bacterium]
MNKKSLAAPSLWRFLVTMKLFVLLGLWLCMAGWAHAQDPFGFGNRNGPKPVKLELVSDTHAIVPGQPFYLALKMMHGPGWHTYWTNPGTGMPTKVAWELPDGFEVGPQISPIPKVKEDSIGNTHTYYDTVYHVYQVTPPATLEGETVTLNGKASWLQCEVDRCDPPKSAPVDITLAVDSQVEVNTEANASIEAVLSQQAEPLDAWTVSLSQTDESFTFTLTPGDGANADPGAVYVFEEDQMLASETPKVTKDGNDIVVSTTKDVEEEITELKGFLYAPNGWLDGEESPKAMPLVAAAVATGDTGVAEEETGSVPSGQAFYKTLDPEKGKAAIKEMRSWGVVGLGGTEVKESGFLLMMLFAFIGGMILNLMPCVFPVIGIKIMGFVQQAGDDKALIRKHGLVYAAGVIVSLWVLVAVLLGLRFAGEQIGWGFQFQEPKFVAFMLLVMFVFGLNLSGLFEIGTSLTGAGSDVDDKGYKGSFFSGILAVLVATPCTGPFMGAALSFAVSKPIYAFPIFTALAVGLALPYVLLSWYPVLVEKLPRPGPWMETFKQFMAFPLFATAIWLLAIFTKGTGEGSVTWMLAGLLVVGFGLWIYGRYGTLMQKARTQWIARATAIACICLFGWTTVKAIAIERAVSTGDTVEKFGMTWHKYSPEKVVALHNEGKGIFIDFTASW